MSTDYLLNTSSVPTEAPIFSAQQADELVARVGSLFAGGTLSDEDKDKVFATITELYWQAKNIKD